MCDKLLTEKQTSELLGVSRTFIWTLRKKGKLKSVTQGGRRIFYRETDIQKYIQSLDEQV
jgi:excisionase family DNA binding protein